MAKAENPELKLDSGPGTEEKINGQTITVSDQKKSDSFVMIDMESFSHGISRESSSNSRIKLQRSLSRKGYQRGNEKIISLDAKSHDTEKSSANSSLRGSSTLEKAAMVGASVPALDPTASITSQVHHHHQITINTANIITTPTESRITARKNSFKRSSHSWILDPKKVLLFFATLSSLGSILLIIFTLYVTKPNADDISLE